MKSYTGTKTNIGPDDIYVINNGVKSILDPKPSELLLTYTSYGFDWGYDGAGPSLTALAILLDLLGKKPALAFYQSFKFDKVSKWSDTFCISGGEIKHWLKQVQAL